MKKQLIIGIALFLILSIAASAVTTKLPIFEGGRFVVRKPGYFTAIEDYSTELGAPGNVNIVLEPFRSKNITIKKYSISKKIELIKHGYVTSKKTWWELMPVAADLAGDEKAILSITKIKDNPAEEDLFNVIIFNGGQEPEEIKLIPGKYEVEISLYYNSVPNSVMIPQDQICYRSCPICSKKCIPLPEIIASSIWPLGTVKYTWIIDKDDLKKGSDLEFYGVSVDIPGTPLMERKHADLENLDNINKFVRDYSILLPRFK